MTQHALTKWLPLALVAGMIWGLQASGLGDGPRGPDAAALTLGFLLLAAWILGKAAASVGLPKITGYLAAGLVFGPHVGSLVTTEMMAAGKAVEGIAVALIALTAGGELRLDWLRKQARRLLIITASELTVVAVGTMALLLLAAPIFPFMPQDSFATALVVAFVFGAIAVANSPTVTIAVIAETRAEGPVARTVLGVTIVKDMCVIVLFASALAVARGVLDADGGGESVALILLRELGGSVVAGVAVGALVALFLRRIGRDIPVFVIGVAFAISEVSSALHLEALLVALTAGFWVENFSKAAGHDLIVGIERVALPVFAIFFASAGAGVDLDALSSLWPLALLLVAARALLVWGGTRLGTHLADAEPEVRRYAWLGFVSQAGVSLALASTVARAFPGWGDEVQVLIVAMIAIHEVVGPIGFQWALRRAGEAREAAGDDPALDTPAVGVATTATS